MLFRSRRGAGTAKGEDTEIFWGNYAQGALGISRFSLYGFDLSYPGEASDSSSLLLDTQGNQITAAGVSVNSIKRDNSGI